MQKNKVMVIKVGTKVVTASDGKLDNDRVKSIADQIADVMDKGIKVILVTSGAIGSGMGLLGLKKRPVRLFELQATASIGQNHLMQVYSDYFRARGYLAGQILLTQEDFNDRKRYLNIKYTIETLLKHNAVPVINENDTVSTEEIKCGDNDRLASLVSDLCQADKLLILSDVDGLLDEEGNVVPEVGDVSAKISKLVKNSHCDLGTGGMATKLEAARRAVQSGIECVIANGRKKDTILKVAAGEGIGTTFKSGSVKLIAKKRWIAFSSRTKGFVMVDAGAREALIKRHTSLLASGILEVHGSFIGGDVIGIADKSSKEFARGLTEYSSLELLKIKGLKTSQIKEVLGYKGQDEVIHKDELVIL